MVAQRWSSGTPSTSASPRDRRPAQPDIAELQAADEARSTRPKWLIMDVCGAYMRPLGGWFPVAKLVVLMGQLGVDEQAVRSALSRLTKRELLVPERRGGIRGYALASSALPLLGDADRRIFAHTAPATVREGWALVSFSIPEAERDKRHLLRSRLAWRGFGNLSSGLWMAPRRILSELTADVTRLGLEEYVTVFEGNHCGFTDLAAVVRRCWDLESLREMYADFLLTAEPMLGKWEGVRRPPGQEAFVDYTVALNQWRKFPYLDPGLPLELLPDGWEGRRAADVFFALRRKLEQPARRHVKATVFPDGPPPQD